MKKFIKFTIIILMITIILLICIIGLFKKKEEKSIYEGEGKSNYITIDNPCIIKKVDDRNMFFAVKNIVKAYLTAMLIMYCLMCLMNQLNTRTIMNL